MTKNKVERSCRFETVTTQSTFTMGTQYSNRLLSPAAFLLWAKTIFGYFVDFSLGLNDPLQYTLLILNPLGTGIILLSLGLYPKHARRGYAIGLIVY
ncbi:sulfatase, partial [Lacticaseibacillus rhamnosus MTCC 5462]